MKKKIVCQFNFKLLAFLNQRINLSTRFYNKMDTHLYNMLGGKKCWKKIPTLHFSRRWVIYGCLLRSDPFFSSSFLTQTAGKVSLSCLLASGGSGLGCLRRGCDQFAIAIALFTKHDLAKTSKGK